jgi:hypothetical protein
VGFAVAFYTGRDRSMNSMMRGIRSFSLALLLGVTSFVHVSGSLAQTVPIVSKKDAEDAQFKVYFGARDGQLALIGEINRLFAYHETLKSRLRTALAEYDGSIEKDTMVQVAQLKTIIKAEIGRTEQFLINYNSTKEADEKTKLVSLFDDKYPLNYKQILQGKLGGFIAIRKTFNALFLSSERLNVSEAYRNTSIESKEIYAKYDDLFTNMDTTRSSRNLRNPF